MKLSLTISEEYLLSVFEHKMMRTVDGPNTN
jgi:hypothetical protein